MRGRLSTLAASTLLAVSLVAGGSAPPAHAAVTKVVQMASSLRFMPMTITIHKGDTIRWKNPAGSGLSHSSQNSHWNSGVVGPGGSFSHKFRSTGTFSYYCRFHKSFGMTGKVIVKP